MYAIVDLTGVEHQVSANCAISLVWYLEYVILREALYHKIDMHFKYFQQWNRVVMLLFCKVCDFYK